MPDWGDLSMSDRLSMARLNTRDLDEMIGLCRGVLADGVVNLAEAIFILQWLEDHPDIVRSWPASVLYEALDAMLEDGQLHPNEEQALLGILVELTGAPVRISLEVVDENGRVINSEERTLTTSTTLPLHEPEEPISFEGKNFCFTGQFLFASRRDCEAVVTQLGARCQKGLNKKTDYLVIGEVGSSAWAHSSFGRKIEKAVLLIEQGCDLYIVSEDTWRRAAGV